jgi:hypothetical protein
VRLRVLELVEHVRRPRKILSITRGVLKPYYLASVNVVQESQDIVRRHCVPCKCTFLQII